MRDALNLLQSRNTEQSAELDAAKKLETVLNQARAVLEKRYTAQSAQLQQTRTDLQAEQWRKS